MNKNKISEIIGNIDDKYVNEAALYAGKAKAARHNRPLIWGTIAACLTVVLVAGAFVLPSVLGNDTGPSRAEEHTAPVIIGGLARPYGNINISVNDSARIWEWEYMTIYEQYTSININGKEFNSRMSEISEALLGDTIGSYKAEGYDHYTDQVYDQTFEARQIQNVSDDLLIAVNMDGKYYVFMNSEYDPPATFGELSDGYFLSDTLALERFTLYEGYDEKGYYSLENDDPIWQALTACQNAPFVEDDFWDCSDKNYISFTATSEALGVYKRAFYISDDGYVWTNIFDWNYIYNIGEETARQIISYATENAAKSEFEPYNSSLAGTLTEICDGYILIDDSILCAEPSDGMVFKVSTDDLRVRRYVDSQVINVGDVVVILFTGDIDAENDNTIAGVYSISPAMISNGDVMINE